MELSVVESMLRAHEQSRVDMESQTDRTHPVVVRPYAQQDRMELDRARAARNGAQ